MCGDGILRTMIVLREAQGVALEHLLASHLIKAQHLVSYGSVVKKLSLSVQREYAYQYLAIIFCTLRHVLAVCMMEVDMDSGTSTTKSCYFKRTQQT